MVGTDCDTKPVTSPRLQGAGKRSRDEHLVRGQVLTQRGPSIGKHIAAEGALRGRVESDQRDQRLGIAAIQIDYRARKLDARLHAGQ